MLLIAITVNLRYKSPTPRPHEETMQYFEFEIKSSFTNIHIQLYCALVGRKERIIIILFIIYYFLTRLRNQRYSTFFSSTLLAQPFGQKNIVAKDSLVDTESFVIGR